ncbi:MAG: transcription antitermination factor NusB [Gammaproteobacteria bacterium]|nr:transcription antitermination factor NusB [Gammaproteobacteria bacterium]MBI5618664.1 transcription antitermination factor NusB [Gammaproteobacteria bacterium]
MADAGSNSGRVRARRCAVQALYQWQLTGQDPNDIYREFVADRELVKVDMGYFATLTREIPARVTELLAELDPALDREWTKIGPVERSVLLIGAYELRYSPHIPWRVVLNEAIELNKMFGADEAHRYVNGVLDKVARRLRPHETRAPEGQS